MPDLPIAFWQSFSPVSPRSCWAGSGVAQSSSEHLGDVSSSAPPQSSSEWEA